MQKSARMQTAEERRLTISEASELVGEPAYILRQWERRFPQLRPKRNRANRRYYTNADIEIIRRIKQLIRKEGLTTEGARQRLDQELHGEGLPKTNSEALALAEALETEIRSLLHRLDAP